MEWVIQPLESLARKIATDVAAVINSALRTRPSFNLVLTGGTLGIATAEELGKQRVDWSRVFIWFGDERFVPLDHPDRNEAQALAVWPGLAEAKFRRYPDATVPLAQAAVDFSREFDVEFGVLEAADSVFDLVLLGMGPDGHVASLFPGHSHSPAWIVPEPASPKPPSERLSMSYEALNRADRVWFIASGAGKAEALRSGMREDGLPVGRVRGLSETICYIDTGLSDAL